MRPFVAFALVCTAGCSLVWSMDDYDNGRRHGPLDASADVGLEERDGASSMGSSGAASSGGSSGTAGTDGGVDAGTDAETCILEPEPNGTGGSPVEIPVGLTCGAIATVEDVDNYKLTTTGPVILTFEISDGIQVVINPAGSGGDDIFFDPGIYTKSFGAGTHSVIVETYTGIGVYRIRR